MEVNDKFVVLPNKVDLSVKLQFKSYYVSVVCDFNVIDEALIRPGELMYETFKSEVIRGPKDKIQFLFLEQPVYYTGNPV